MKTKHTIVILFAMLGVLGGCSAGDSGKSFDFPDFSLTISTDPETLQVGKSAEIRVAITDEEHVAKSGCVVRFHQYMPGMEMNMDDTYIDMSEGKKGTYSGRSREFSMGGDWMLEFDIKCQSATHTAQIPYHLEWPK